MNTAIPNMNVDFRKAQPVDASAVTSLYNQSLEYKRSMNDDAWGSGSFTVEEVGGMIQASTLYLGLADTQLVAAFNLSESDENMWDADGLDDSAIYIHQLAVGSEWHGKGIGALCIEYAKGYANGMDRGKLRLDCGKENSSLCNYYLSLGFSVHEKSNGSNTMYFELVVDK
jgi:ribosomal protein S18 acetylase RimI-like enzyme